MSPQSLRENISKAFLSPEYSDLRVRCAKEVFYLHKIFVLKQSKPLADKLRNMPGGLRWEISLEDDDPPNLRRMFEFMDRQSYTITDCDYPWRCTIHTNLYVVGNKYQMEHLVNHSRQAYRSTIAGLTPQDSPSFLATVELIYRNFKEPEHEMRVISKRAMSDNLNNLWALPGWKALWRNTPEIAADVLGDITIDARLEPRFLRRAHGHTQRFNFNNTTNEWDCLVCNASNGRLGHGILLHAL
ncbi:hypothetical protein BJ875DRAFT_105893 [Amylocarpus encephaloides]|uniref:BTB domain-containing protein n=1 Tax=Amylocarpus encephaloides TaxID=45428 RepID=A0A9P7YDB3_9HELO|nr:hypothetical protein BJ875DRAFT_105893 [Amylocarpus encephaloides]